MTPAPMSLNENSRVEDVLAYLPHAKPTAYHSGQVIYGPALPSNRIHLLLSGKVLISQVRPEGSEVLLNVLSTDELFGESAFLDVRCPGEQATAFEKADVMAWPVSELEELVTKRPRLALALLQILARRNADLSCRIESFATDTIELRLARSLLHFSERLGSPEGNGAVRMMPFTHAMLSRYVGTSREIITQYMNRFRKQGYVEYSRQNIVLYPGSLAALLGKSA